jgi:hypothetical protein
VDLFHQRAACQRDAPAQPVLLREPPASEEGRNADVPGTVTITSPAAIAGCMLVFGLGMGCAFLPGTIASLTDAPEQDSGIAAGIQNISFSLGTTLGLAILSAISAAVIHSSQTGDRRRWPHQRPDHRLPHGVHRRGTARRAGPGRERCHLPQQAPRGRQARRKPERPKAPAPQQKAAAMSSAASRRLHQRDPVTTPRRTPENFWRAVDP